MSLNPCPAEIWVVDDAASVDAYDSILSIQFELKTFTSLEELTASKGAPALVIVDPPTLDPLATVKRLAEFPFVIATRNDDLDFMRACLKGGARAVLLKPLRQSEVVITLEKALGVELLPCELEGRPVPGLTLKERQLLASFLTRRNMLTRAELVRALWRAVNVNRKTLDVHLFNLRRKIHPLGFDIVCEGPAYGLRRLEPVIQEQFSAG